MSYLGSRHSLRIFSVDMRRSFCFSKIENGQCASSNGMNITKSMCCCSMGAGWGDPCELCPEKGTKEFDYYCPNGVGLTKDNLGKKVFLKNRLKNLINSQRHDIVNCT